VLECSFYWQVALSPETTRPEQKRTPLIHSRRDRSRFDRLPPLPRNRPAPTQSEPRRIRKVWQGVRLTKSKRLWVNRVQFDHDSHVLKVEKDQPVRLSKLDPQFAANADAVAKGASARAAAEDAARLKAAAFRDAKIKVVSNGGEEVDLASLMTPGKITVVDFYADWCGPCKRISPHLEQLAKTDPDVVLLKIDIVNWNTPVTRQFGIQSVPNVRVFGGTGAQFGDATPDVNLVKRHVEQAKGS